MAKEAFAVGAVVGNDISGFADPDYLSVAAAAGATVVATHIRLGPRIPDPDPVYDDVVEAVRGFLLERASWARAAGCRRTGSSSTPAWTSGRPQPQSLTLLRASGRWPRSGYPLLLSASNKTFLGVVLGLETRRAPRGVAGRRRPRRGPGLPDHAGARRGRPPTGV